MSSAHPGASASPPPPGDLKFRLERVAQGRILHRIHDSRFEPVGFNPGYGNSRFAPFAVSSSVVPTAYAATSFECAAFETIFHDVDAAAPFKTVAVSQLARLSYSTFVASRDLNLAALFSADLMRFGLQRHQVIDTPAMAYATTRLWSVAAHSYAPSADGMIWVSRRYDEERALVMFGDRLPENTLMPLSSTPILQNAMALKTLLDLGDRAGIEFVA